MVTDTMLRLEAERIDYSRLKSEVKTKAWINIDMQKQMAIQNVYVWEIIDGQNRLYRLSIPGLAQNNYNDRIMIKGKQTEKHVLGQYANKKTLINMNNITHYLTDEEQMLYIQLLNSNNIRGCVEYLRMIETRLNTETKDSVKVRVRIVKKGI